MVAVKLDIFDTGTGETFCTCLQRFEAETPVAPRQIQTMLELGGDYFFSGLRNVCEFFHFSAENSGASF